MKLYATTTSNRATKGQGGDYLDIEIKGENQEVIFELKAKQEAGRYIIEGYAISYHTKNESLRSESYYKYELVGKKPLAERCQVCGQLTACNPPSTHCIPL